MTQYIDPNSGAAPQPGGYVGAHSAEYGHVQPVDQEVEQKRQLNQPFDEVFEYPESKLEEASSDEEEGEDAKEDGDDEISAPAPLIETPQGDTVSEEEASDAKALETEAVELESAAQAAGDGDGDDDATGEEDGEGEDVSGQEAYDPSQYSVNEVNDYLDANPEQREAVVAAERAGKNRKTITGDE